MTIPIIPPEIAAAPLQVRIAYWQTLGVALGLPVDELLETIDIQMKAARRTIGSKSVQFTEYERFRLVGLAAKLCTPFRKLIHWLRSPDSFIKWAKRRQERLANAPKSGEMKSGPGRKGISDETENAILKVYMSGITGLKRIRGELMKCGITISKTTIRKVLRKHGLPPGRSGATPGSTWARFLRLHADRILAVDFIQVPVGWFKDAAYAFVFFGIELDTRRVHVLGVTLNPDKEWITNVVRSATMDGAPLHTRKYWIHDQDGKFYYPLPAALRSAGLKGVMTSIQAPDMNAFAERWVRSIRNECLDHIIFRDATHLNEVVDEYVEHYNTERPHQGIGNVPVGEWEPQTEGEIVCDERLCGLLKSFRRAA